MKIKCFNCELKDGVIVYYKDILFCSKECEELLWSKKEKDKFNKNLDKLVNIYKEKCLKVEFLFWNRPSRVSRTLNNLMMMMMMTVRMTVMWVMTVRTLMLMMLTMISDSPYAERIISNAPKNSCRRGRRREEGRKEGGEG